MASRRPTQTLDPQVEALLDAATAHTRTIATAEAARFELAAAWAEAHPAPVERVVDEDGALVMFGDQPIAIAGEGAPGMSEFAVAEFAAAIGMSTYQGRRFLGSAVETKHRLPKIWARVIAGQIPVWKVRRVTERTHRLTPQGASHVDATLAPILHTCSCVQIESAADKAAAEADDERYEQERAERHHQQHLDIDLSDADLNHGLLDRLDAIALDRAVKDRAHALLGEHPDLDLDHRRAMALGDLADGASGGVGGRELVIYTHHDPDQGHNILDIETAGHTTIEQIAQWCQRAGTRVSIRPVLDLGEDFATDAYAPTTRQREQAVLTLPTCVFPHCSRSARGCDLDHITPWHRGGKTESWNLAPLCRLHHRLKTLGYWSYTRLTKTSFEWTSPMGRSTPTTSRTNGGEPADPHPTHHWSVGPQSRAPR